MLGHTVNKRERLQLKRRERQVSLVEQTLFCHLLSPPVTWKPPYAFPAPIPSTLVYWTLPRGHSLTLLIRSQLNTNFSLKKKFISIKLYVCQTPYLSTCHFLIGTLMTGMATIISIYDFRKATWDKRRGSKERHTNISLKLRSYRVVNVRFNKSDTRVGNSDILWYLSLQTDTFKDIFIRVLM